MTEPERVSIAITVGEPVTITVRVQNTEGSQDGLELVLATTYLNVEDFSNAEYRAPGGSAWTPIQAYAGAYGLASLAVPVDVSAGMDEEFGLRFTLAEHAAGERDADMSVRTDPGSADVLGTKGLMLLVTTEAATGPTVTAIDPATGSEAGGTTVTLSGENLTAESFTVLFKTADDRTVTSAVTPTVESDTTATFVVPAKAMGSQMNPWDVVLNKSGTQLARLSAAWTYEEES